MSSLVFVVMFFGQFFCFFLRRFVVVAELAELLLSLAQHTVVKMMKNYELGEFSTLTSQNVHECIIRQFYDP